MGSLCCKPSPPPYTESDETTPLVKSPPKSPEGWILAESSQSYPVYYILNAISTMPTSTGNLTAKTVSVRFCDFKPKPPFVDAWTKGDFASRITIALQSQIDGGVHLVGKMGATANEIDELRRITAEFMENRTPPRSIEL